MALEDATTVLAGVVVTGPPPGGEGLELRAASAPSNLGACRASAMVSRHRHRPCERPRVGDQSSWEWARPRCVHPTEPYTPGFHGGRACGLVGNSGQPPGRRCPHGLHHLARTSRPSTHLAASEPAGAPADPSNRPRAAPAGCSARTAPAAANPRGTVRPSARAGCRWHRPAASPPRSATAGVGRERGHRTSSTATSARSPRPRGTARPAASSAPPCWRASLNAIAGPVPSPTWSRGRRPRAPRRRERGYDQAELVAWRPRPRAGPAVPAAAAAPHPRWRPQTGAGRAERVWGGPTFVARPLRPAAPRRPRGRRRRDDRRHASVPRHGRCGSPAARTWCWPRLLPRRLDPASRRLRRPARSSPGRHGAPPAVHRGGLTSSRRPPRGSREAAPQVGLATAYGNPRSHPPRR